MKVDSTSNEKEKNNSSIKLDSNIKLNFQNENQNVKNELNNNEIKNKFSSFNNIQISSNNNNDDIQKGISYTYITNDKKPKQNLQISNINYNNNKYSNNNSHQGISFIAQNQKNKCNNFQTKAIINSQQGISYIAPKSKNLKENKISIESNNYTKSENNGISYLANQKPNKVFQISSNPNQNEFNSTSQGISYIAQEKTNPKDVNKNLTINSSSNNNSQNIISYFPQANKNFTNYKIEHNPINNKEGQKGIYYIAPNKPKKFVISNSNQNTHQEIHYIAPKKIIPQYKISSNNNNINYNQNSFDYKLSTQKNNTYTYIAPGKKKKNGFEDKQTTILKKNNLEISSNNNIYFYLSKNEDGGKNDSDNFKFKHNESMTFICKEKKENKNNLFIQCEGDKFKYVKDDATGAQIMENELN